MFHLKPQGQAALSAGRLMTGLGRDLRPLKGLQRTKRHLNILFIHLFFFLCQSSLGVPRLNFRVHSKLLAPEAQT